MNGEQLKCIYNKAYPSNRDNICKGAKLEKADLCNNSLNYFVY